MAWRERWQQLRKEWRTTWAKPKSAVQLDLLRAQARLGQSLTKLQACNCGGWSVLQAQRQHWKERYALQALDASLSDRARADLVREWAGLEGFFGYLTYCIKRGEDAQQELQQTTRTEGSTGDLLDASHGMDRRSRSGSAE